MAILQNAAFKNKNLVTAYGKIYFGEDGTAEVEDSIAKKLATLKGFFVVEEPEDDKEDEEPIEEPEETDLRSELMKLTVKQLEKYARDHHIDLGGATRRADIISVILEE